jgi:Spy/CpxP family protein refolding chaperone
MRSELLGPAIIGALALYVVAAIACCVAIVLMPKPAGGGPGQTHDHGVTYGLTMEQLTKALNMTPDQKAKVQPIIDQARPQIIAINKDKLKRRQRVVDKTISQIRLLLAPDQQKRIDDAQRTRQDVLTARRDRCVALKE